MRTTLKITFMTAIIFGLIGVAGPSQAQFGKLKNKVKKKAEQKTDKKVDKEIDKAMDDVLEGDVLKGDDKAKESKPAADEATAESAGGSETAGGEASSTEASTTTATASSAKSVKPGTGAWLNYDFVPGDQVIYYEDFRDDYVGDFPQRLTFVTGNMEVAEWEGDQYVRIPGKSKFDITLKSPLPDKFTLETDMHLGKSQLLYIYTCDGSTKIAHNKAKEFVEVYRINPKSLRVKIERPGSGVITQDDVDMEGLFTLRLMLSGSYLKVYVNENRVANIPNSEFGRTSHLRFETYYNEREPTLFKDMRLAEGGRNILYKKLEADGRVATHGILFDSGSDVIRPESTPTLEEIGKMLQKYEDLNLLIEGHTDSQGEEAYNQELSDKRAAAVKRYICAEYDIADGRLQTKGFGESQPVDSNDTPEGRQNNRRVELVKL
jgi:OOP family OmpA-OmpF porin